MAAEEILLQLLKACENHHANCHPNYHPQNGGRDYDCHSDENDLVPSTCKSAITNLRMLIPKLECTIAPPLDRNNANGDGGDGGTVVKGSGKSNNNNNSNINSNSNSKTLSKDILQLCRFYDNVVRGTYCPHMPHLLGCGKDPKLILDKILYLLRNTLNLDLGSGNSNININRNQQFSKGEKATKRNNSPYWRNRRRNRSLERMKVGEAQFLAKENEVAE